MRTLDLGKQQDIHLNCISITDLEVKIGTPSSDIYRYSVYKVVKVVKVLLSKGNSQWPVTAKTCKKDIVMVGNWKKKFDFAVSRTS